MTVTHATAWTACGVIAWLGTIAAAAAAGQQARLTIDVTVKGSESASAGAGSDWGKSTISERYHLVTTVKSDGVLSSVNGKDPAYAQKAMAQAAHDRAKIRAAQENLAAKGIGPKPLSGDAANALLQEMQAAVAKCGADEACKQGVAMKYATRPDFAAAMAALSTPGYACKQQAGGDAARERECLEAYGVDEDAPPVDLDEEETPPDERYLNYIGWIGCPSEITIQVDNRLEGAYADVGGMVPYTHTDVADRHGTPTDRESLCVYYSIVLDTKADMLYTDGFAMPQVIGTSTDSEPRRGEPQRTPDAQLSAIPPGVAEFLRDVLLVRPLSGTKHGTVKLARPYMPRPPISTYSGQVEVDVSWKFERL